MHLAFLLFLFRLPRGCFLKMMMNGFCFFREPGARLINGFDAALSARFAKFLYSKEFLRFEANLRLLVADVEDRAC